MRYAVGWMLGVPFSVIVLWYLVVTQRAEGKSTPLAPALAGTMVNRHDRRLTKHATTARLEAGR